MTEIIRRIVGLMLAALQSLAICLFLWLGEQLAVRPRWSWPTVIRRRAFADHPPEAWAAP